MFHTLQQHYQRADQRKALALLDDPSEYPALPSLRQASMLLQAYIVPSFQPMTSWTLYRLGDEGYQVRRVRWDFPADHRVELGEPTTYGADSHPAAVLVERHLEGLASISFPAFHFSRSFGLDGATFGLRSLTFCSSCEFSWWSQPPAGCEPLAEWYQLFVDFIESSLPSHTSHFRQDAVRP